MFTGLVEEVGQIGGLNPTDGSLVLVINCRKVIEDAALGDSIAVNGCCLTVTRLLEDGFEALASHETLSLTNLGDLRVGSPVNLERSVTLNSRMGGHLVQGHVDGTGTVVSFAAEGDSQRWKFAAPPALMAQMIMKGSITVNGVSLTVAGLGSDSFEVALIPATLELTTFPSLKPGDRVNLETDLIGKYVFRYMSAMGVPALPEAPAGSL